MERSTPKTWPGSMISKVGVGEAETEGTMLAIKAMKGSERMMENISIKLKNERAPKVKSESC